MVSSPISLWNEARALGAIVLWVGPKIRYVHILHYAIVTYPALYDTRACCIWMLHMGCRLFFSFILLLAFLPIMLAESCDSLLHLFIPSKGKDKVGGEPSSF